MKGRNPEIDGDFDSFWSTSFSKESVEITLELPGGLVRNAVVLSSRAAVGHLAVRGEEEMPSTTTSSTLRLLLQGLSYPRVLNDSVGGD